MPLPHPILRRLLLRRGLVLWVLARLALLAVVLFSALSGGSPSIVPLTLAMPQMLPLLALLVWIDLHRRREVTLIGNLGQSQGAAVLIACLPGVAGEVVALTAAALFTA
ncbi:MAG TPA: hypothetical protein VLE53_11750 [Gemmatimonadaceae bacterium]|nr:hypothetical protein [Gemmatimonadaceae bacterium]